MRIRLASSFVTMLTLGATLVHAQTAGDRKVVAVTLTSGTAKTVSGSIKGYSYTDYQVKLGAGQSLSASLQNPTKRAFMSILPPGTTTYYMFDGSMSGNKAIKQAPVEGTYSVRVYMMRNEARRAGTVPFKLTLGVSGKALIPIKASADALIPGTPYHASSELNVATDGKVIKCKAFVIRRSMDGTATVEVRMPNDLKRRILFVKGKPVASDSTEKMAISRSADNTVIKFGSFETITIPDALVLGG